MTHSPRRPGTSTSGERFARLPLFTLALIALNLVSWFTVAGYYGLTPFAPHNSALLLKVGAVNYELLRAGEWWRIFSSQFLHVYFPHMVFNLAGLALLGSMLEREIGTRRLALAIAASGLIGQLAGVAAAPGLVSSGASQALMGLAGWAIVRRLRRPGRDKVLLVSAFVIAGVQVLLDVVTSGGIKAGHLGGFLAGAALSLLMSGRQARA
jgi:rhomboid protease GluP